MKTSLVLAVTIAASLYSCSKDTPPEVQDLSSTPKSEYPANYSFTKFDGFSDLYTCTKNGEVNATGHTMYSFFTENSLRSKLISKAPKGWYGYSLLNDSVIVYKTLSGTDTTSNIYSYQKSGDTLIYNTGTREERILKSGNTLQRLGMHATVTKLISGSNYSVTDFNEVYIAEWKGKNIQLLKSLNTPDTCFTRTYREIYTK